MCRTTADAIQWVLSQDGGVEGAEGGWLPGALLLRTSADCCAFSRTSGNRSSATIVGSAFQCVALVQQEGARLPRGFPMWSLTRVMQSLTSTTLLEFYCYVGLNRAVPHLACSARCQSGDGERRVVMAVLPTKESHVSVAHFFKPVYACVYVCMYVCMYMYDIYMYMYMYIHVYPYSYT